MWLNSELDRRGWSRSEAARRGEVSASMMDKVIGGFSKPGLRFYRGIARAFNMPMEDVLRMAGILPTVPNQVQVRERPRVVYEVNGAELILALWRALSSEDQERVRDLMERLARVEARIIGADTGD